MKELIKFNCIVCGKEKIWKGGLKEFNKIECRTCSTKCSNIKRGIIYINKMDYTIENYKKSSIFRSIKKTHNKRNIDFDLSFQDIPEIPKICPVLGIELVLDNKIPSRNSPSIDRIDSSKGYIKSNIRIISNRANFIKNNGTKEEIETIYLNWKRLREEGIMV
jgi:transcription elongation factor Elf1